MIFYDRKVRVVLTATKRYLGYENLDISRRIDRRIDICVPEDTNLLNETLRQKLYFSLINR